MTQITANGNVTNTLRAQDLRQFSGTESWYKHMSGYLFTDGVKYVAEKASAWWLIDDILFTSAQATLLRQQLFLLWRLKVNEGQKGAELICEDGNGQEIFRQIYIFTDFPLPEIRFYLTNNVLLLPSEY